MTDLFSDVSLFKGCKPHFEHANSPLEILDRMRLIVEREKLVHGTYFVTGEKPKSDAPCGGNKFCAYGALVWSAGARFDNSFGLEGVGSSERDEFAKHAPHLPQARCTLNEVAQEYIDSGRFGADKFGHNGVDPDDEEIDALERLFEAYVGVTHETLLEVIDEAKRRLVAVAT